MDPITAAVLAVAPALATELVSDAVKDAYSGLKAVIRRKWGEASALQRAVEEVEAQPESKARAAVLEEEVANTAANDDPDLMTAVARLVDELKNAGIGGKELANIKVSISGGSVVGVVGAHEAHIENMTVDNSTKPPERKTT